MDGVCWAAYRQNALKTSNIEQVEDGGFPIGLRISLLLSAVPGSGIARMVVALNPSSVQCC